AARGLPICSPFVALYSAAGSRVFGSTKATRHPAWLSLPNEPFKSQTSLSCTRTEERTGQRRRDSDKLAKNDNMTPKTIAALNKQANQELQAAQAYLALAYWCDVHHHGGFAKFFHEQAAEEHVHARK